MKIATTLFSVFCLGVLIVAAFYIKEQPKNADIPITFALGWVVGGLWSLVQLKEKKSFNK